MKQKQTMAFVGWKPAIVSTVSPTRWMLSPICAVNRTWGMLHDPVEHRKMYTFWRLFHVTGNIPNLTWIQAFCWNFLRVHDPYFSDFVLLPGMTWGNLVTLNVESALSNGGKIKNVTIPFRRTPACILINEITPRYLLYLDIKGNMRGLPPLRTWLTMNQT